LPLPLAEHAASKPESAIAVSAARTFNFMVASLPTISAQTVGSLLRANPIGADMSRQKGRLKRSSVAAVLR